MPETARRLVAQLRACEVAALSFCRLLEAWARGDADPCSAGRREAALRRAADRAETAGARLERPPERYPLALEPHPAEGRSWYAGPGAGEVRAWGDALCPARAHASLPVGGTAGWRAGQAVAEGLEREGWLETV